MINRKSVIESVKKTGRLVVAHEAVKRAGWGAEIVATVVKEAFDYLLKTKSDINKKLILKLHKLVTKNTLKKEIEWAQVRKGDFFIKVNETGEVKDVFSLKLIHKSTNVSTSIRDVGFGLSQLIPVIIQSLSVNEKTLLVEQPELHLHPALQAELGDLFIEAALKRNNFF